MAQMNPLATFVDVAVCTTRDYLQETRRLLYKLSSSDARIATLLRGDESIFPEAATLLVRLDAVEKVALFINELVSKLGKRVAVDCCRRGINIHNGTETIIREINETAKALYAEQVAAEQKEVDDLKHMLAHDLKTDPNGHRQMGANAS